MRGEVGCVGIAVDAKPAAVSFYERRAFVVIGAPSADGGATRMFLPMETVEAGWGRSAGNDRATRCGILRGR
jgi:hypothetical protein